MKANAEQKIFTRIQITIDNQVELDVLLDALKVYANDRLLELGRVNIFNNVPNNNVSYETGSSIATEFVTCIESAQGIKTSFKTRFA